MPRGLVVGDTSLGRDKDPVPSLPGCGEPVVLLVFVLVCGCFDGWIVSVVPLSVQVLASFIVQGPQVYKG
jgi:hypothetical protein